MDVLPFDKVGDMNDIETEKFFSDFVSLVQNLGNEAADQHLKAGRWIAYYDEDICGDDETIREYPDGRKELVTLDNKGEIIVLRQL